MATNPANPLLDRSLKPAPCPPKPEINWYVRFLDGPQVKPMKAKEKAWLAVRNVVDPFNALTILGLAGIAVASDSHSPYGPGMPVFGRYVGVSYTEDMTGEFFGTFLISSLDHQDPHYHRMPAASIPRRVGHAMLQVSGLLIPALIVHALHQQPKVDRCFPEDANGHIPPAPGNPRPSILQQAFPIIPAVRQKVGIAERFTKPACLLQVKVGQRIYGKL